MPNPALLRYSQARLPTPAGDLTLVVYREVGSPDREVGSSYEKEHVALVAGTLEALRGEGVLCRVHSECWTGETLASLKCDCREQLDHALGEIVRAGRGVVVYLRQEGRGIGLGNKIKAYALQDQGADTVEANEQLGFAADLRSYDLAADMLRDLGVTSVALMTNNPDKLAGLERAGIKVTERRPHWVGAHEHNQSYLDAKKSKLGHAK
jgi:GTP cyclohydrolase II